MFYIDHGGTIRAIEWSNRVSKIKWYLPKGREEVGIDPCTDRPTTTSRWNLVKAGCALPPSPPGTNEADDDRV